MTLLTALKGRKIVLASSSQRRVELLRRILKLEFEAITPDFEENLNHSDYNTPQDYSVATASGKALDVYEKLAAQDLDVDMVVASDTVVVSRGEILEKPKSKAEQLERLREYNDSSVQVVTGVVIVTPTPAAPGYVLQSIVVTTDVIFDDNSDELLQAYVATGEGHDRAGGFAIQEQGGVLIKEIKGDYNNIVGFPCQSFFKWINLLDEEGRLFFE